METFPLQLPEEMRNSAKGYPVVWVNTSTADLKAPESVERVQIQLNEAFSVVQEAAVSGQCLIKVHIGEPSCDTRMRPEFCRPAVEFLLKRGASGVVYGDTTVAYTGPRGYRQNPPEDEDASVYLELARRHGWQKDGPSGAPFVVLDRPASSIPNRFEFESEEVVEKCDGTKIFSDFYVAGGFQASDFVINQAHLTLHGLAGVAGCVKSVAMGCASLTGKLRMHQSLSPHFEEKLCIACGQCVSSCPEDALHLSPKMLKPIVDEEHCIGCGECVSICPQGAVQLHSKEISDWTRGQETISQRMADYVVGLLNGRWHKVIHVLHLVDVTPLCDCVDIKQEPITPTHLGFLVGKNPFALDVTGARLFRQCLIQENKPFDPHVWETAEETARYAKAHYGISFEAPIQTI